MLPRGIITARMGVMALLFVITSIFTPLWAQTKPTIQVNQEGYYPGAHKSAFIFLSQSLLSIYRTSTDKFQMELHRQSFSRRVI
jgi:hypothetical protein